MARIAPIVFALLCTPLACETTEAPMTKRPSADPGPAPEIVPVPGDPASRPFTEPGLEVSLIPAGPPAPGGSVPLTFRLANTGAETRRVCTLFTPFEGRDRLTLEVRDAAGARLPLRAPKQPGPMPQPEDHVELAPGQALERQLDLRHDFELPPGRYTIRFRGAGLVNHLPDSPPLAIEIP